MRSWVLRVKFHLVSCCIQRKSLHISAQQMISVLLPSPRSQLFYLLPQLKNKQWYCHHEPEINTTLKIIKFSKEEIYQPLTPKISLAILLTTGHIILDVSSENLVLDQLIIPKLILFFILIASLLDIVLITSGEILFWSLIGVKGLTVYNTVNVLNVGEGEEGGIWSHGLIIEQLNWWWLLPRISITIIYWQQSFLDQNGIRLCF